MFSNKTKCILQVIPSGKRPAPRPPSSVINDSAPTTPTISPQTPTPTSPTSSNPTPFISVSPKKGPAPTIPNNNNNNYNNNVNEKKVSTSSISSSISDNTIVTPPVISSPSSKGPAPQPIVKHDPSPPKEIPTVVESDTSDIPIEDTKVPESPIELKKSEVSEEVLDNTSQITCKVNDNNKENYS